MLDPKRTRRGVGCLLRIHLQPTLCAVMLLLVQTVCPVEGQHSFRYAQPLVNISAVLLALQGVDPGQLAAQTAANARLRWDGKAFGPQAPSLPESQALSPELLNSIARGLAPGYVFSSSPPGYVFSSSPPPPTYQDLPANLPQTPVLGGLKASSPAISNDPGPSQDLPSQDLQAPVPVPGPLVAPISSGRQLLAEGAEFVPQPGTADGPAFFPPSKAQPASSAPQGAKQSFKSTALPPQAIATSPGAYALPSPRGSLAAYRVPGSVPPTRSLNT